MLATLRKLCKGRRWAGTRLKLQVRESLVTARGYDQPSSPRDIEATAIACSRPNAPPQVAAACAAVGRDGFINYFGLQRFGAGGAPTHEVSCARPWYPTHSMLH